ncbi:alpha/beta-hydrolase [Aspergillus karnatakaensis]|uniref:alpha/beta hydrolase n=1 Tax=Aspergillus karnatakaensis TaxID=1810916 RepID=UPI003CCD982A
MPKLPTLLLIHGAWHTPSHYSTLITALQNKGFTVHAPHLPTCNPEFHGKATLSDDINLVRSLAISLIERGEKIILIMHSYGGVVGTEAVSGLALPYSGSRTGSGGIVHLLYLAAYILPPKTSVWDIVQQSGFDTLWDQYIHTEKSTNTIFPVDPAMMFFSNDPSIAPGFVEDAVKGLVRFPFSALKERTAGARKIWADVPGTYVSTRERDGAVPGVYQGIMLERVEREGVRVREVEVDGCHSVWVGREGEMVGLVEGVVEGL